MAIFNSINNFCFIGNLDCMLLSSLHYPRLAVLKVWFTDLPEIPEIFSFHILIFIRLERILIMKYFAYYMTKSQENTFNIAGIWLNICQMSGETAAQNVYIAEKQ